MAQEPEKQTRPRPTEEMVRLGGDPHRLLDGEDPQSEYRDDARHWIAVYQELLAFKHDILGTIRRRVPELSASARTEVFDTDLPVMEAEAQRFVHRIEFWQSRLDQLGGGPESSGHG
jgi:hypothetical protein